MRKPRMEDKVLCLLLIAAAMLALIYEAWVIWFDRWDLTISLQMLALTEGRPFVVIVVAGSCGLAIGVLLGHWLWPLR